MKFQASRFWSMKSWTKLLMPDSIEILDTRIIVTKKKWFGLSSTEEEITYKKIASVRLKKGVFTGTIIIETLGGATEDLSIKNFKKKVAVKIAGILREKIEVPVRA